MFHPETKIVYNLARGSFVHLDICKLQGQRVATLVDEHQGIGRYTVIWAGQNDHDRKVAAGVYFYCLSTSHTVLASKMIYLP